MRLLQELFLHKINSRKGFTLIELLVVFSITAILAGIGVASLASYSRTQQISQTANDVKSLVNQARFSALSAVKAGRALDGTTVDCGIDTLLGYSIEVIDDHIDLTLDCATESYILKSIVLPDELAFDSPSGGQTQCTRFHFDPLSAKSSGLPCSIVITGFGQDKTVAVDVIGNTAID